jgi:hypothetical protein
MSLLNILTDVGSEIVGANLTVDAERTKVINLINRAAKEIYESSDLVGCLREQVFYSDLTDNYQITLPYYVSEIRGIRQSGSRYPLTLEQMSPRYTTQDWGGHQKNWREKFRTPLETSLDNASHLTFLMTDIMTVPVVINISGSTPTSDRVMETVTILPGSLQETSGNLWTSFPGVKVIHKNIITTTNVEIQNDAGDTVGHIPNCEYDSTNLLVQVINTQSGCNNNSNGNSTPCPSGVGCKCWEILYKIKLLPFYSDFDEFPCDGYEEAIRWKASELWWANQPGQEDRANLAFTKCKQIIESRLVDARKGITVKMDFKKSKYSNLHYYDRRMITPIRLTQGIYPVFPVCGDGSYGGGY